MSAYRQKLFFFIGLVFSFLSIMLIINYFVDPGNEFNHLDLFENQVLSLLSKDSVMICNYYNDRNLKKTMLDKLTYKPDVLILGSSRVYPADSHFFGNLSLFNAAVVRANLADDIALYYLFAKRWQKPKIVLIGLDPWIIEQDNLWNEWKSTYHQDYVEAQRFLFHHKNNQYMSYLEGIYNKYKNLISASYFKSTLKENAWIRKTLGKPMPEEDVVLAPERKEKSNYSLCFQQNADGSRYSPEESEKLSFLAAKALSNVDVHKQLNERLHDINPQSVTVFENFIRYLTVQHIRVIFYFPPYDRAMYNVLIKKSKIIDINNYFRHVAKIYHIQTIGSYDPKQINLSSHDFVDAYHLRKEKMDKVLKQLRLC